MGCIGIPEIDLGEWGVHLKSQMNWGQYPLNGSIELTDRCNLGCVHCFINQPAASQPARSSEMTTGQVKDVFDQMAEAGVLFLTLTGGEILIRTDFEEIYRYGRQKGFLLALFTNGTLITPRYAELFTELRPQAIELTMYGATRETYEAVTQVPGSYDRFRRGVDLLLERKLPASLKTFLITKNYHEFAAMRALAEELGVRFRYDGLLWPRFDGDQKALTHQIPLEELVALDMNDPERLVEWKRLKEQLSGKRYREVRVYSCGAGKHSFHVDSQARMSICTMTRHPSYNVLEMGFQQAWEKIGDLHKLVRQKETICQTCTLGALCPQCPGWSQAVHGDDETPVDFICQLGHMRAFKLNSV